MKSAAPKPAAGFMHYLAPRQQRLKVALLCPATPPTFHRRAGESAKHENDHPIDTGLRAHCQHQAD